MKNLVKIRMKVSLFLFKAGSKFKMLKEVFYIGSGEVLPPPLKPEEEMDLISQLKEENNELKNLLNDILRITALSATWLFAYLPLKYDKNRYRLSWKSRDNEKY